MNAPSGRTSPTPFAYFDHESASWKTSQLSLELGNLNESPTPWPESGMTCGGHAYELRMSGRRTNANASSSSPTLPTPNAEVDRGVRSREGVERRIAKGDKQISLEDAVVLLPTPVVADACGTRNSTANRKPTAKPANIGDTLTDAMWKLLPTLRATDGTNGGPDQRSSKGDLMLPSAVTDL